MSPNPSVTFRLPALEREALARAVEREGLSKAEIMRRALRRELEAPDAGRLDLIVDPALATRLLDKAAQMGRRSEDLMAALLREYLPELTEADLNPLSPAERARKALESV